MKKTKLAIIGSGPAGYTAAIYAARALLQPLVFTGLESGGQLMYTTQLENFPGFPEGVLGPKFMMDLRTQANNFGAEIIDNQVIAVDFSQQPFKLWTKLPENLSLADYKKLNKEEVLKLQTKIKQNPADVEAESVIIATGARAITLGVPGERKFMGKGVSVCAVCDAAFFRDREVFVIGGGDSAMEDAMALTKFAKTVTIIHRRAEFRASKIMQDRVLSNPKIKVLWNSNLKEILGDKMVEKIKVEVEGEVKEFKAEGVFMAIGHQPATSLVVDQLLLSPKGYLITNNSASKQGLDLASKNLDDHQVVVYPSMTSVEGVFAAGDVIDFHYSQAIVAAGTGAKAALDAEKWLNQ